MNLETDDLEIAYYCAGAVIRSRQLSDRPIPAKLRRFYDRLDLALRCMALPGHENDRDGPQFNSAEWITTREAATILNRSPRQTRRLKDVLDGQDIGGRLQFPRSAVESYAQERTIR